MGPFNPRILSQPYKVYWAGWETTTTRLQQCGWEISAEEDIYSRSIRIALRHQQAQVTAISNLVPYDYFRQGQYLEHGPEFHMAYMASRLFVSIQDNLTAFKPIDAMPQFVNTERKSIEDLGIFATPLVRTEEIIVEPQDVASLLEQIKQIQLPEQAAIRARQRLKEGREGQAHPRQKFHAQILSIAA